LSTSLHDELFADAAAVLLEVQGAAPVGEEAAIELHFDGVQEPVRVGGLVGGRKLDRVEGAGGSVSVRKQVERCQVRVSHRDSQGLPWTPEFTMKVRVGQDLEKWTVEQLAGVGTALVTIDLVRTWIVNKQAAGRERKG
jgi:hypothetical protein